MRFLDLRGSQDLTIARPIASEAELETVRAIIRQVREGGDEALISLTQRFDGVDLSRTGISVNADEISEATDAIDRDLLGALKEAAARIETFAHQQALQPWKSTIGGAVVGEGVHAVRRAGAYVPGGRASYPSSVLMCGVPAKVAGVKEMALCVPPRPDGSVDPAVLAACQIAGVSEVYRLGGAQAIAAMALGTESVKRTDVIVGPGNIYVALAKRELAGVVAIDSVAGPSEIAIVADDNARPELIAIDLIAQAEHGPGGAFLVVSWSEALLGQVRAAVDRKLSQLGESQIKAYVDQSLLVLVDDRDAAIRCVEEFAPEHLELLFETADEKAWDIRNAGAVFVGPWSPVSLGDYMAGSNHVLPTGGAGRWASGLRTSHFQRAYAVVAHDRASLEMARGYIETLASTEGLPNHSAAVEVRFEGE